MTAQIIDFNETDQYQQQEAARILVTALAHVPSAWADAASASAEVASFLNNSERLALMGMESGHVRGWIGAIRHSPFGWELHPLVVEPRFQGQGWGRRLVTALEDVARAAGVVTIWLGTDDDFGGTNLFGQDLYPDVLARLQELRVAAWHPFTFYRHLGYTVTGIFPDVAGPGRHDILMARRIAHPSSGSG